MTVETPAEPLKQWNDPRVELLDVADSEVMKGRGRDGSTLANQTAS